MPASTGLEASSVSGFGGHDGGDGLAGIPSNREHAVAQVAVGDDAPQRVVLVDEQRRDAVFGHLLGRRGDRGVGRHGDGRALGELAHRRHEQGLGLLAAADRLERGDQPFLQAADVEIVERGAAGAQLVESRRRHGPDQPVLDQGDAEAHRLAGQEGLQPEALAFTVAADQVAVLVVRLHRAAPDDAEALVLVADLEQHGALAAVDRLDGRRRPTPEIAIEQVERRGFLEELFDVSQRVAHNRQS
jgi:hypothetical protein